MAATKEMMDMDMMEIKLMMKIYHKDVDEDIVGDAER